MLLLFWKHPSRTSVGPTCGTIRTVLVALLWSGSDSIGLTGERGLPSLLLVTLLNQE